MAEGTFQFQCVASPLCLQVIGRTDGNRLCHIEGSTDLIGKIVEVDIVDTFTFSLRGKLVTEKSEKREEQKELAAHC